MAFVDCGNPEVRPAAAAGTLQGIGAAMSSQNAAAGGADDWWKCRCPRRPMRCRRLTAAQSSPRTHADVSGMVNGTQAAAIHELFVHTLGRAEARGLMRPPGGETPPAGRLSESRHVGFRRFCRPRSPRR